MSVLHPQVTVDVPGFATADVEVDEQLAPLIEGARQSRRVELRCPAVTR